MSLEFPTGLSVAVQIDGRSLPVFAPKHTTEPLGTEKSEGWICSQVDKIYSIQLDAMDWRTRAYGFKDLQLIVSVDGVITERRAVREQDPAVYVMTGPRKAADEIWPYKFEKPKLQEDDHDETAGPLNTAIGTIEIRVVRVVYDPQPKPFVSQGMPKMTSSMSEKQKKGTLSAVTQFGETVKVRPTSSVSVILSQDSAEYPYCRLVLRYASKDILTAMDIIPVDHRDRVSASASPEPAPGRVKQREESPVPSISAAADRLRRAREELEKAERENAALEASIASSSGAGAPSGSGKRKRGAGDVKDEEDEEDEEDLLRARKKMEREMKDALKDYDGTAIDLTEEENFAFAPVFVKGETIDLTDD